MANQGSELHHHDSDGSSIGRGGAQHPEDGERELVGKRARRRVTQRLMPFLIVAYLLAYVDRANLGIAKLQMQGDLGFTDATIGLGAGIFFIGYFLLEIPGSLIVERWSARKWFARIMISWGLVAALTRFRHHPKAVLYFAFRAGSGRSGFLSGRHRLPFTLVSLRRPHTCKIVVHDDAAAIRRGRHAALSLDS